MCGSSILETGKVHLALLNYKAEGRPHRLHIFTSLVLLVQFAVGAAASEPVTLRN